MSQPHKFRYQRMFELGPDQTKYRHLGSDGITTKKIGDQQILVVEDKALALLASEAIDDIYHL